RVTIVSRAGAHRALTTLTPSVVFPSPRASSIEEIALQRARIEQCSSKRERCLTLLVMPVLRAPDRRQHGLSETPTARPADVEPERETEALEPPLDDFDLREQVWPVDRVAQHGTELVLELADDTFHVDRAPAACAIRQHVVVMQVAVQQRGIALRRAEVRIDSLGGLDERHRHAVVAAAGMAHECAGPL